MDFAKLVGNGRSVLAAIEACSTVSECANPVAEQLGTVFLTGQPQQRSDYPDQPNAGYSEADQWAFLDNSPSEKRQQKERTLPPLVPRHNLHNGMTDSDPIIVPDAAMTFINIEEVYALWKLYGKRTGFAVQKRGSHKIDGQPYRATFICSRGRKPRPHHPRKKKLNRIDPAPVKPYKARRCGIHSTNCPARLVITDKMLVGNWKVHFMYLVHNHELSPESAKFFRCHRELPDFVKKQLEINDHAGVPQKHSFKAVVAQAGGYEKTTYISRDLYNYIMRTRLAHMGDGDASSLIKYFKKRQLKNPDFFYECSYDETDRLKRVFWADARSRAAYRYFGDVVSFDTTYLTNKYGMSFSPFVGVNQHGQTVFFGCALLNDETTETYSWLLDTWVTCMDGRAPKGIITDQCYAMGVAIQNCLPGTRHRLCLWHIMKKLPVKIGQAQSRQHILPWAKQVVYNSISEKEFEEGWTEIIESFPLLIGDRSGSQPCLTYEKNGSRCSSINFFGWACQRPNVFAQANRARLQSEKLEDFRNFNETPTLISNHPFEHQIMKHYTTSMIYMFQAEVKQLININCCRINTQSNLATFSVSELCPSFYSEDGNDTIKQGRMTSRQVTVDTRSGQYNCPCNMFHFRGVVCRHALSVYSQVGITIIPGEYVLSRWCTDKSRSKELDSLVPDLDDVDYVDEQHLYTSSHSHLLDLIQLCGNNASLADELTAGLLNLKIQIAKSKAEMVTKPHDGGQLSEDERPVRDPQHAKPVGRPRSLRLKPTYDPSSSSRTATTRSSGRKAVPSAPPSTELFVSEANTVQKDDSAEEDAQLPRYEAGQETYGNDLLAYNDLSVRTGETHTSLLLSFQSQIDEAC